MKITKRDISSQSNSGNDSFIPKEQNVGNYKCETTKVSGIYKILSHKGGYLVRCNYGKVEKISKKDGTKKITNEVTLNIGIYLICSISSFNSHSKNSYILSPSVQFKIISYTYIMFFSSFKNSKCDH